MNWVIAALIVFVSSTVLYLTLRKINEVNDEIKNLTLFLPPGLFLFFYSLIKRISFNINTRDLLLIILISFFLWLGNVFMLKSVKRAPNPGYTVLIGKSYVAMTVLLSPLIFGSFISPASVILVLLILFFLSLILIDKKTKGKMVDNSWVTYAFATLIFWGLQALLTVGMKNIDPIILLMYLAFFSSLMIGGEMVIKKVSLAPIKRNLFWLMLLGASGLLFGFFIITGYRIAPNPGFMDAANASSVAAITLFSAWFFKDEITLKKGVGIVGALVCLILLLL